MLKPPLKFRPFSDDVLEDLQAHVKQVRRLYDWPGIPYHDAGAPPENTFNRWAYHNPPLCRALHHTPELIDIASEFFGTRVRPSYAFLSMYGDDGVCPQHQDRPQCFGTIDLLVNDYGANPWPIHIQCRSDSGDTYTLKPGEAIIYSGEHQPHHRDRMKDTCSGKQDLLFFHFVPVTFNQAVD